MSLIIKSRLTTTMLDEPSITLLRKIFVGSTSSSTGINAQKFRAENHEEINLIDSLVSSGFIETRDGHYLLRLITLPEIEASTPQAQTLLNLCEHLFKVLRIAYLKNPGSNILLHELADLANTPIQQIYTAIPYLAEASLIHGYPSDLAASDAFITPAEQLLRYKSFNQLVEERRSWSIKTEATKYSTVPWSKTFSSDKDELAFENLLHSAIIEHALPQFRNGHLRDAVLNAITAVFELIRQKTNLNDDGERLIGKVFSLTKPFLILSEIETESGKSDQRGFMQIFNGAYQGIRNPKAHSLDHDLTPIKAAQYLVLASLLARRVDEAEVMKQ